MPDHEQVAHAAYHLYLERGRVNGHDLDDWLHAEELLASAYESEVKEASTKATKSAPGEAMPFPPEPKHVSHNGNGLHDHHPRNAATRETIRQQTTAMRSAPRVVASHGDR